MKEITFENVKETMEYIKKVYKDMKRRSGEPVEKHSIEVALLLAEKDYNYDFQIVGLLHDVLEDTDQTVVDIKKELPFVTDEMLDGVLSLTKTKNMSLEESLSLAKANKYGRVIKGADRLQNARSTYKDKNTQEFISGFLYKTIQFYIPVLEEVNNEYLGDLLKEVDRLESYLVPEAKKWLDERIQVYCVKCKNLKTVIGEDGELLYGCKYDDECCCYDIEDSMAKCDRPHYERID